jgi:hypothetical protein
MSLRALLKTALTVLGASVFAFMAPGLSAAKDLCLTINSSTYVLIGKNFTVPMRGKCKPWTGLTVQGNSNSPSAGTGCTSSNGSHLNLTITTTFPELGGFFLDSVTLALPGLTGTDIDAQLGSGDSIGSFSAVGAFCAPVPIPAVTAGSAEPTTQGVGPTAR